jgi:DNA polymerase III subunit alpha, Gram-positive type
MKQAAESLVVHEQKKKERKEQSPALEGPIQLGRNIPADEPTTPMINIVEEERRSHS